MSLFVASLLVLILPLLLFPSYFRREAIFVEAVLNRHPIKNVALDLKYSRLGLTPRHFAIKLLRRRYCDGDTALLRQRAALLRYHWVFAASAIIAITLFAVGLVRLVEGS